jgi:hypothetical protein
VRAAIGPAPPIEAVSQYSWVNYRVVSQFKHPGYLSAVGGSASAVVDVPPGRYDAWIAGSMGPGVAMWARRASTPKFTQVGYAANDMGLSVLWQPIGSVDLAGRTVVHLSWAPRSWWKASSRHANIIGPLVLTRVGDRARIVDVPAARASSLCGRRLDWLEIPSG